MCTWNAMQATLHKSVSQMQKCKCQWTMSFVVEWLAKITFQSLIASETHTICFFQDPLTGMLRLYIVIKCLWFQISNYSNTNPAQNNVVHDWPDFQGALWRRKRSSLQKKKIFTRLIINILHCSPTSWESTWINLNFHSLQVMSVCSDLQDECTWTPTQCCKF